MAWIELHNTVRNNRKTYDLMMALNVSKPVAVGMLAMLWTWALEAAEDGDVSRFPARAIADACEWKKKPEKLLEALISSGWLERTDDGHVLIHDWDEYTWRYFDKVEHTREQTRKRVHEYRERKKSSLSNAKSVTQVTPNPLRGNECNAPTEPNLTEPNLTKPKDNDSCASGDARSAPSPKETEAVFERLWAAYPIKRGKGHVSAAAKRRLFEIGEDHMLRAIDRFKADMKAQARPPDKQPYGSTFFTTGYIDYLDENYTEIKGDTHNAGNQGFSTGRNPPSIGETI